MDTPVVVGIDFGTTKSSIAVWNNGKIEIVANDQGDRTCPSYVAFTNMDRLIGDVAVHQIDVNPHNTVFDAKRIIGRKFNDPKLQEDIKFWPFQVINTENHIKIQVEYRDEVKKFAPEEICSMIFTKLKDTAEAYLGVKVHDAVISVPAQFNDAQRQATVDAGKIAGFNVLQIINDPTAAALAYGLNNNVKGKRHVLIFDFGGGTFDVSVLTIVEDSSVQVKATGGNTHLGGVDFDKRLANYLAEECRRKFQKDLRRDTSAVRRFRTAAEKAKRALSTSIEACIEIAGLTEDLDFYTTISRSHFERICADLFRGILQPVDQVLLDAKMDKSSIDDVLLVGGTTNMPMIRFLVRKHFSGRILDLCNIMNEPIAYGAAMQAAILTGDNNPKLQNMSLIDITSISIGYETNGCVMTNIIDKNTKKPCKKTRVFTTHKDNQDVIIVDVYEGERVVTKYNNYLGTFKLNEIPPGVSGKPQIEVAFDIDANGILKVTAKELIRKNTRDILITDNTDRLTQAEIGQLIVDAEIYRVYDQDRLETIAARNYFDEYMHKTKQSAIAAGHKIAEFEQTMIINNCESYLQWLEDNPLVGKAQCHDKLDEFRSVHTAILTKIHGSGDASPTFETY